MKTKTLLIGLLIGALAGGTTYVYVNDVSVGDWVHWAFHEMFCDDCSTHLSDPEPVDLMPVQEPDMERCTDDWYGPGGEPVDPPQVQ